MEQAGPFGRIQHDLAGQFQHGALNACKTVELYCVCAFTFQAVQAAVTLP